MVLDDDELDQAAQVVDGSADFVVVVVEDELLELHPSHDESTEVLAAAAPIMAAAMNDFILILGLLVSRKE